MAAFTLPSSRLCAYGWHELPAALPVHVSHSHGLARMIVLDGVAGCENPCALAWDRYRLGSTKANGMRNPMAALEAKIDSEHENSLLNVLSSLKHMRRTLLLGQKHEIFNHPLQSIEANASCQRPAAGHYKIFRCALAIRVLQHSSAQDMTVSALQRRL